MVWLRGLWISSGSVLMAVSRGWRRERRRVALRHRAGLFVYGGAEGGLEEGSLGEALFYLAGKEHLLPRRIVTQQPPRLPADRFWERGILRKRLQKLPSVNHSACSLRWHGHWHLPPFSSCT